MRTHVTHLFLYLILVFVSHIADANPPKGYAIVNVSVIPMTSDTILQARTVIVEKDVIKSILRSDKKVPKGYVTVNGTGKYLIPGLFDMHAHFYYEQGENRNTCEEELKLMLANGLTTVRIQCGDPVYLEARENVRSGKWQGPNLFISSPQLVGSWPWGGKVFGAVCTTPEEGAQAVKKFSVAGYDEIKITFMLKKDVFEAVNKTANEFGIKVTGHVGPLVKLPTALKWRQQNEHMDEFIDMLLPDTTLNHGQSVSDMNIWRKNAWETVPHLDESRIQDLVRMVRESNVYVTPTNYFFFSFFGRTIDEATATTSPQWQFVPGLMKADAAKVREHYLKNLPPLESRDRYVSLRQHITNELWKAGVKLMAGSDSPQWYSATGFTLHNELETFVECGLSPYAALETATINPATYLGIEKQVGTIQSGKKANLILLDLDPLENISNTRQISGVFINGKFFDKAAVEKLLSEASVLGK